MRLKELDMKLKSDLRKHVFKKIDILGGIFVVLSFISIIWVQNSYQIYDKNFYIVAKAIGVSLLLGIFAINGHFLKKESIDHVYIVNILVGLLLGYELITFIELIIDKNNVILNDTTIIQSLFSMVVIFGLFSGIIFFYNKIRYLLLNKNKMIIQLIQVMIGIMIEKLSFFSLLIDNDIFIKVCFVLFMIECFYIVFQGFKNYKLYEDFYCYCAAVFIFLQIIAVTHISLYEGIITGVLIFSELVRVLSYIFIFIVSSICVVWENKVLKYAIDNYRSEEKMVKAFNQIVKYSKRKVIIINSNYFVIYVNDGIDEFINNKDIMGVNICEFINKYKNDIDFKNIEEELVKENRWSGELTIWEDLKQYFLKCEIISMVEEGKLENEYAILLEDITDNKVLYEKLQKSENRVVDMANNMVDFLVKVDKNLAMEFISTSYCNALGYSYKELRGAPVFRFIHEDDKEVVYEHARQCLKTNSFSHIEYRMRVKGGKYIWVESIGNYKVDNNGNFESAVITSRDISKRKYYEKALIESEKKYREFFNMVPNYIYVVSLNNDSIEEVNKSMNDTFIGGKFEYNELVTLDRIFSKENAQIHYRYFYEVLKGRQDVEFELNVKNINDEDTLLQININPIYCDDRIVKILCMAKDITDKRKIEELQIINETDRKKLLDAMEYDRIKTEFFANISHELRTPINVILAAIQLDELEEKKNLSSDKKYKNRDILKQNCFRLLRLINNLIDLTKIDSGYYELNLINCDMVNVVESVFQSIVPYAKNKDINMLFDTNVEECIMAIDLDKIERIILNLISNAIKFTPRGGEIYVNLIYNNNYVEIHIKDTGRGIPGEKLDYIFERFRQIDKSLSRDHEGSGIGLYLVKNLVELHGGQIWVSSSLGRGSDFIIQLPHKLVENDEVALALENELYKSPIERVKIELSDIYEI